MAKEQLQRGVVEPPVFAAAASVETPKPTVTTAESPKPTIAAQTPVLPTVKEVSAEDIPADDSDFMKETEIPLDDLKPVRRCGDFRLQRLIVVNKYRAPDLAKKPYAQWTAADLARSDCYRRLSVHALLNPADYPIDKGTEKVVRRSYVDFNSETERDNELRAFATYNDPFTIAPKGGLTPAQVAEVEAMMKQRAAV